MRRPKSSAWPGRHFTNPHGLDAEGHYSTARDMARLGACAMENEDFARIVSTKSVTVHGSEIYNHNKLLGMYSGCTGIKTGYTMAAGRTLVSCAERDGARYVCVTLDDRQDWDDHAALYDWAFENYEYVKVVDSDTTYRVNAVNRRGRCTQGPGRRAMGMRCCRRERSTSSRWSCRPLSSAL